MIGRRALSSAAIVLLAACLHGCTLGCRPSAAEVDAGASGPARDQAWAQPVPVPMNPQAHVYRVSDRLYRGPQPDDQMMRGLKAMGIRTVLNLRSTHDDREEAEAAGLAYRRVPVTAYALDDDDGARFLRAIREETSPIYVYCIWGSDRTGMMIALHRIVNEGWTKEQAIQEMLYGCYGFNALWQNMIDYVWDADIEHLRRQVAADDLK